MLHEDVFCCNGTKIMDECNQPKEGTCTMNQCTRVVRENVTFDVTMHFHVIMWFGLPVTGERYSVRKSPYGTYTIMNMI